MVSFQRTARPVRGTPHQGDGSAVTGRRTTGNVVQAQGSTEELDLMCDPQRELEHLGKLAAAEPTKRFGTLYRLVSHPQMLSLAGEHVRQNTGARTAGHKQHHPGGW